MSKKHSFWHKFGIFFYDNWKITILLIFFVVSLGLTAYTRLMKREGFPSVEIPIGIAQIVSLGGDAKTTDQNYALPIAQLAKASPLAKKVATSSSDQGATVTIMYKDGTNVQAELDKIKDSAKDKLPQEGAKIFYLKINAGKLTAEGDDLLVSVHSSALDEREIDQKARDLSQMIKTAGLSQVADVHLFPSFETVTNPVTGEQLSSQVRFDKFYHAGQTDVASSTLIGVKGKASSDQLKLYDQVKQFLDKQNSTSSNYRAEISISFAEQIREQVSALQRNLMEGLVVVLIISFILISFRSSLVTALSMTITILTTVGVLHLIGYSLNTITLFSLVLCLALIVDDTTIMVEAIDAGLKKGRQFRDVVLEAMSRVIRASATGTMATILAFAPMLFIGGILGKFVRAIPVTIIISLVVSLLVSFIFIPILMRFSFGRSLSHKKRIFSPAEKLEEHIGNRLAKTLIWSDKNRKRRIVMRSLSVLIGLGFLAAGGLIFSKVDFNIFPTPKDGDRILVVSRVKDAENANIDSTKVYAARSLSVIKSILGDNLERLSLVGETGSADRNGFSADIVIKPINQRDATAVELSKRLQEALTQQVPELTSKASTAGAGPPNGNFNVRVKVSDEAKSYNLANEIKAYVETTKIKRLNGTTANFVEVAITPSTVIERSDGDRIINVSANFDAKDTSALVSLGQELVEDKFTASYVQSKDMPKDSVSFDFGQEEENQESFASMGRATGPLFLAMFLVMAILFRSILQPLLIFTALPFAIFGVASGLYLTNNEISFFTMLGVFALIGISLNNTILLTDYANQASKTAKRPAEAMATAIKARLRPLLTTSLTSVLALLPLALNDPFWEGLAFTLIFGLISSTILVLIAFPYFYLIDESFNQVLKRLFRKLFRRPSYRNS